MPMGSTPRLCFEAAVQAVYDPSIRSNYTMNTKEITNWQEETAHTRYQLIMPLVDPDLAPAERAELRRKIADEHDISERTLFRYELNYRTDGFTGLKPANRSQRRRAGLPDNFDELVGTAIQLTAPQWSHLICMFCFLSLNFLIILP